jgi:hypothetical protein
VTGVFKNQFDWLPLEIGSVRPTQRRTFTGMQVSGGSQSIDAVNTPRLPSRWMRIFTTPNQSSVPRAYEQFDDAGRMKPSANYDRVVDVMEELIRSTWLLPDRADYPVDPIASARPPSNCRRPDARDHSSTSLSGSSSRFSAPGGKCSASTAPHRSIAATKPSAGRPSFTADTSA